MHSAQLFGLKTASGELAGANNRQPVSERLQAARDFCARATGVRVVGFGLHFATQK